MRCKACNNILSKQDLHVDEEMCRHCLSFIYCDITISNQLIDDEEDIEGEDNET